MLIRFAHSPSLLTTTMAESGRELLLFFSIMAACHLSAWHGVAVGQRNPRWRSIQRWCPQMQLCLHHCAGEWFNANDYKTSPSPLQRLSQPERVIFTINKRICSNKQRLRARGAGDSACKRKWARGGCEARESDGRSYLLIFHFHLMPACSKMVALCEPHLVTGGRGQAGDEGEGNSNASRTRSGKTASQATCPSSFPFPGIMASRIC